MHSVAHELLWNLSPARSTGRFFFSAPASAAVPCCAWRRPSFTVVRQDVALFMSNQTEISVWFDINKATSCRTTVKDGLRQAQQGTAADAGALKKKRPVLRAGDRFHNSSCATLCINHEAD